MRIKSLKAFPANEDELAMFENWMDKTAELIDELFNFGEFSPLMDNERSAVGCFLGGAIKCGLPAAVEYTIKRKSKLDRRKSKEGRADLWFSADGVSFSFEFKLYNPDYRWNKRLWDAIDDAHDDMCRVNPSEYDSSFSAVISPDFGVDIQDQITEVSACEDVHYVFQLIRNGVPYAHIFFSRVGSK